MKGKKRMSNASERMGYAVIPFTLFTRSPPLLAFLLKILLNDCY